MHGLALQDPGNPHHILIAGVGAAADEHLVHLDGSDVLHGVHVIRHMGLGHQGLQGVQVDIDNFIIFGVRVRAQFPEIRFPALGLQEGAGHFVTGEYGGGGA